MKESQMSLIDRLREFIEMEARSGSMDPGCITPLYIYRMWGGSVSMEDIENAMEDVRRMMAEGLWKKTSMSDG